MELPRTARATGGVDGTGDGLSCDSAPRLQAGAKHSTIEPIVAPSLESFIDGNIVDHENTGWRRIFEYSPVFDGLQSLLGADRSQRRFLRDVVQPFPGAEILDIGCGTASVLDYLPEGVDYTGYDLNRRYIDSARRRYGDRGNFSCARVDTFVDGERAARYDIVLASAVLHHLGDSEAIDLIISAHRHLRPGGVFCTWDCVRVPDQSKIARFLISRDRGRRVRDAAGYDDLVGGCFLDRRMWVIHDSLRVPYSICAIRAKKS